MNDLQRAPRADGDWLAARLLFCAGAAALALPWLSGLYTIPWDAKAQAYPQLAFLARALAAGDSPFWTPGVFAGHPQIADPQSLIFSPPFLLLAWLDPLPSFRQADAVVFAMLTLAGLALMAFFRDRGWRPEGAMVCAFAFAFGGSNAWRIQHIGEVLSLCWFAIALFFLSRALARGSWLNGLAAGFTAGFMVLGRDQIACLCAYLLVIFVIWNLCGAGLGSNPGANPRANIGARLRAVIAPLGAGLAAGLAVTIAPLAFSIALAAQSNRPAIDFADAARGSLPPLSLLTAFAANLYGVDGPMANFWGPPSSMVWGDNDFILARNMGAVYFGALPVAALLGAGLARGALLRADIRCFALGAVLMALYAVGSFTPVFQLLYHVPGVDLFRRPADATFPLCALLAVLAGYCVNAMLEERGAPRSMIAGAALGAPALAGCALVAWDRGRLGQAAWPLAIAAGSFLLAFAALALAWRHQTRHPRLALACLAAVMTLDLAVSNKPNESTALPPETYEALRFDTGDEAIALIKRRLAETAAPDRRDRVELAAVGYDWPNAGLVHGFEHDLGFNPVRLKLFADATGAGDQIAIPEQRKFSRLYAGFASPMADLLGVRLLVTGGRPEAMDPSFRESDFKLLAATPSARVYENPRALPRVMFAAQSRRADFAAMLADGVWPAVDFTQTVLLEAPGDAAPRAPGAARIVSYANTEIVIEGDSPAGGHIVLNDVFHPWWRATIDGGPAEILQANVMFRAVSVPPGKHRVTFRFEPMRGLLAQLFP